MDRMTDWVSKLIYWVSLGIMGAVMLWSLTG